jgi:Raf kinase inhibitor-like YbhB/YbcL family protein
VERSATRQRPRKHRSRQLCLCRRCADAGAGENISPPLAWSNVPLGTAELVLVVQDPDAPLPRPVVHVIATRIPPDRAGLAEGALAPQAGQTIGFGRGSFGRIGYAGPRPPRGHGAHRYIFQIFALATPPTGAGPLGLGALVSAMFGSVLVRGRLTGLFERN